jgi:3-deoxy-manno-octulosonate cytidylyltransferase (CMP-KDO synthetase)
MRILGIIPARMAATRFPNKPMAEILGIPMIGHCYLRSNLCKLFDDLYVATCDETIVNYIHSIGGKAIMTSEKHERASERTAEALLNIEILQNFKQYDIVVMIQGDEPLVEPGMLEEVIKPLMQGDKEVSNLMSVLRTEEDINNPNNVKTVVDIFGDAIYMSREPIPSKAKYSKTIEVYRQLGLIAFTRISLLKFVSLPPSNLEIIESVDMNRFIENRVSVHMELTSYEADSVDIPDDLIRLEEKMKKNDLFINGYFTNEN